MGINLSLGEGDDIQIKGTTDGTLIGNIGDRLKVDASLNAESSAATYSAAVGNLVLPLLATDFFTITGSATKTIRITQLTISATGSAGANQNLILVKRSTANTGGTSTTPTAVPHDSNSAAGTATVRAYTTNPTALGTLVGTVRSQKLFTSGVSTAAAEPITWDFGTRNTQSIYLRGTSQVLALNLSGVTVTSPLFNIFIEWTES